MGNNPIADAIAFGICLTWCTWLCNDGWRPRRRVVLVQPAPVVLAQPATYVLRSKGPEPATLPALALEVPPPPKAEVVERV